jgi:hypothetical protein
MHDKSRGSTHQSPKEVNTFDKREEGIRVCESEPYPQKETLWEYLSGTGPILRYIVHFDSYFQDESSSWERTSGVEIETTQDVYLLPSGSYSHYPCRPFCLGRSFDSTSSLEEEYIKFYLHMRQRTCL